MAMKMMCIGGPLDGEWMTVLHGNKLVVYRGESRPIDAEPTQATKAPQRYVYRRQIFGFGSVKAWFWVLADSDDADNLKIIDERFPRGAFPKPPATTPGVEEV